MVAKRNNCVYTLVGGKQKMIEVKMGIKQVVLTLLLIGWLFSASAQVKEDSTLPNTFFLEVGGNGLFYSLNYDRILLAQNKWKVSGRLGVMYLPGIQYANRQVAGLPLEISYWRGKKNHHWEVGLGLTPIYDTYPLSESSIEELAIMGVARIGYRYQKREGGLFYKIGFTPVHGAVYNIRQRHKRPGDTFTYPLAGLAIGYTLKR